MARMRLLKDAVNNTVEGFCIIKSVIIKNNIKGSDYLDLILADVDGEIVAKLWDYNPDNHGQYCPNDIVKVRGSINVWKDAEQLKVDKMRAVLPDDDVNMSLLVPAAPFDGEWMYEKLWEYTEQFLNPDLKLLTQHLLKHNKTQLLYHPAALKLHHAQRSGLLYHTFTMLQVAESICKIYPVLDSDLVYSGVILHDIAKLSELISSEFGIATSYSTKGQLLGHIAMGVSLLERTCLELDISEEIATLMAHIMLSHHGVPEHGSIRPPMFPEAEVVSQIDLLDSRLYEMFDALKDVPEGELSERVWALDNRQLYKRKPD